MKADNCNRCSKDLDNSNWHPSARKRRWLICKDCANIRNVEYYRSNPSGGQARNRKTKYGIDNETYKTMEKDQNYVCLICSRPERYKGRDNLCVDHDHKTGKVRGLLCSSCNKALGLLEDNVEWLRKAEDYLARNNAKPYG